MMKRHRYPHLTQDLLSKKGKMFLFCTIRGMALIHSFPGVDESPGNLTKNELIDLAFSKGESDD